MDKKICTVPDCGKEAEKMLPNNEWVCYEDYLSFLESEQLKI